MFQKFEVFPHLTVLENIALAPQKVKGMSKREAEELADKLLDRVGIPEQRNKYASALSGGQQQRVAVARALVFDPAVVLMDEPLGALDKNLRESMQYEIKHIHESIGVTVVYVTHDQVEAMTLADRIIIMKDGFIEQIGSPVEVFNNPVNVFVATFIGSPPMNIIECSVLEKNNELMIELDDNIMVKCPKNIMSKIKNSKKVIIGLTSDEFALKNGKKLENNYEKRHTSLKSLIEEKFLDSKYEIAKLENDFGPAVIEGNVEALIVSTETQQKGDILNRLRAEKNLQPVKIISVPMVLAEDGNRISTTRIRDMEIDFNGKLR